MFNNSQDVKDWIFNNKETLVPFIQNKIKEYQTQRSFKEDLNQIVLEEVYIKYVLPTHYGFVRDILLRYVDRVGKEMQFNEQG